MRAILLAIAVSLVGAAGSLRGQSADLTAASQQSDALKALGRYAEAEAHARRALELGTAEFGSDHRVSAILRNNLAELYRLQGRYDEAEPHYRTSLAVLRALLGSDHPEVGTSLWILAELYRAQGRNGEAERHYDSALAIAVRALGPDHRDVARALNGLAQLQITLGRHDAAEPNLKRALAIQETALGPGHIEVARTLSNLAQLAWERGRYGEAESLHRQALVIFERTLGPDHPEFARVLNSLALFRAEQGRDDEAAPLFERALAIQERILGPDHPDLASTLSNLAGLYRARGRVSEAEPLYTRAIAIDERALGPDHPDVATALGNLALLREDQGRYDEAERLHRRSLAIREQALGPDHPHVALSLTNLAGLVRVQGRIDEAEPLGERALAITEAGLGPDHPRVATALLNLADLYLAQGRSSEAETLFKRSVAISESARGPDHPNVATALNNLAGLYYAQGRLGEAEPLYRRGLAITEKALGPTHPEVARTLNNLAALFQEQGRNDEAEPLLERIPAVLEAALGPGHPDVATALNNLAEFYRVQSRNDEAEALFKRALAIRERALGPQHPAVGASLNNLALLYQSQGRADEAERLQLRDLAIAERAFGPDHHVVASALNNLADLYRAAGRHDLTVTHLRRASAIHRARAARARGDRDTGGLNEQRMARPVFLRHLQAVLETPVADAADLTVRSALTAEAFAVSQLANITRTGAAISRMAARSAAGNDALAALVRERQDAVERWRSLDSQLVAAMSRPAAASAATGEATLRQELSALDAGIGRIDARLVTAFPQFAELSAPQPVPLAEAQALLAPDEALLTYLVWTERTFIFAVRRDRVLIRQIRLGAAELEQAVAVLRHGLSPRGIRTLDDIPPFDRALAFALYQRLIQTVETALAGARHVFVVPDGALWSLPLSVLVTTPQDGAIGDLSGYRQVSWLAREYALTTLPSVSSLTALRRFGKPAKAARPFLGIGDPTLTGETGSGRGPGLAALFVARGVADVDRVRRMASLPETAGELGSLASTLGAGDDALLLGSEATETRIKRERLTDYRVIAFATHGLVAGALTGLAEPALVLTPPAEATALDDGLLTASEVARLKLDADWVILSACDTAAADGTPSAEGLSGLAKAFFYAGSRTLLVSHWPVASQAAVAITTRMMKEAGKPGVGRSEAHRRAMLALIDDPDRPHFAHPLFWAPFVVVGEGGSLN